MFGTGALLRGLVGHLLEESNRAGKFNGRIVAIGSTGSGRDNLLNSQDGLFTLLSEGVYEGQTERDYRVISSIRRALSASHWNDVLALARNPDIGVIFSNTTEVGIALEKDDGPELLPPKSFPAKLTRFLFERARAFDYSAASGVLVVPCELVDRNGELLGELALQLAEEWRLGDKFTEWLCESVSFANTLVDRIVSGAPDLSRMDVIESELGFRDSLVTVCEPYRLLAVEGDKRIRDWVVRVSADPGFFATDDVGPYRERKVRILNGGHTTMVPAALLAGLETVHDVMSDEQLGAFVRAAIFEEIIPPLQVPGAEKFAREVLERFANPFIDHSLIDISLHGTAKMRTRIIPSLVAYSAREGRPPANLTFGFAAHLVFMRGDIHSARAAAHLPVPADNTRDHLRAAWRDAGSSSESISRMVEELCADSELWGTDLTALPGFVSAVNRNVSAILRDGARAALKYAAGPRIEARMAS